MNNDFDKNIQDLLTSHTEQPSADCWDKVASQLDALKVPDSNVDPSSSASSGNASSFSQFMGSVTGKIISVVVAVATVGGIVSLIVVNSIENDTVKKNESEIVIEENPTLLSNEEEIQLIDETDIISGKQKSTDTISILEPIPVFKDTTTSRQGEKVLVKMDTTHVVSTNPASQPEVKNVPKTETTPKVEDKKQPAVQKPKKEQIYDDNKPVLDEDISEDEKSPDKPQQPKINIPSFFSPNGDHINDYFVIEEIDQFPETHLTVFRRDGRVVYEKANYQNDWGADNVPDGVYYYIFKFVYQDSQFMRNGSITIRR